MDLDLYAFDESLGALLAAHRRALGMVRRGEEPPPPPLTTTSLLHPEHFSALRESDDPLAQALLPWFLVLVDERADWEPQSRLAQLRHALHPAPHLDEPTTIAALVRGTLGARTPGERRDHARMLVELAPELSDRTVAAIEARRHRAEGERFGTVDELTPAQVSALAGRVLDHTEDIAAEVMTRGWVEGLHATLGSTASEGWPAKLTERWLGAVFGDAGLTDGLPVVLGPLPRPAGASSFARALGQLGVAVLSAGRPGHLPRALHLHPFGLRRHRRYGLFAGLVVSPAFATKVLGLGKERAEVHRRETARALAASLRIDALRVLVGQALGDGRAAARERLAELGERIFAQPLPPELLGVLPRQRPVQAAAFVGQALSADEHRRLVRRHDEDWFQNPRAIAELREMDEKPRDAEPVTEHTVDEALEALREALEAPF